MRNATTLVVLLAVNFVAGCAAPNGGGADIDAASRALRASDYDQAIAKADAALNRKGSKSAVAEAQYVKGRALEDRPVRNEQEKRENLQAARTAYIAALEASPTKQVEGQIRCSLADVAYWQDDYTTSSQQWAAAAPLLDDPETAAWALYRKGVSQQRLNQFTDADATFDAVAKTYPASELAVRAVSKQGKRNFVVQVGTFANATAADRLVADLKRQALPVTKVLTPAGRHVVNLGPFGRYPDAAAARLKVAGTYPDALIVP